MEYNSKMKENLFRNLVLLTLLSIISISLIGTATAKIVAEPNVTKTVSPVDINIIGSGTNEETTVAITVTGAGNINASAVPMDVVFAIDSSASMAKFHDNKAPSDPKNLRLSASNIFLDKMNSSRDLAGVVSWDNKIDFSLHLTSDFKALKAKIGTVDSVGGTDLNVGLNEAINILDNDTGTGKTKVIIFLTDGITNSGAAYSSEDAKNAASKGYVIYSIGLGSNVDSDSLKDMANRTGGEYYLSPSADNLQSIFNEIFKKVTTSDAPCYVDVVESTQNYIVDESSFNVTPDNIVTNDSGITTITWKNISKEYGSSDLSSDKTVVLSFKAKSNLSGANLAVDVPGISKVNYKDSDGIAAGSVDIPQAYINVNHIENPPVPTPTPDENDPPLAEAGPDQNVTDSAAISLNGSGSTDDGKKEPLSYTWTWSDGSASGVIPTISLLNGTTTITLTVYDGEFSSSDTVNINVNNSTHNNNPPIAEAGPDQNVTDGAAISLNGSGSTDDGRIGPLNYTWAWNGGSASGASPTISLPNGTTTITLTVYDGELSSNDTVNITINSSCRLRPPVAAFCATPISGKAPLTVKFTDDSKGTVTSRSWDFGDKNTSQVQNPLHAYTKKGTYTVTFSVKNSAGNSTAEKMINVTVK
jgi:Ca-activated chloride channel family protein